MNVRLPIFSAVLIIALASLLLHPIRISNDISAFFPESGSAENTLLRQTLKIQLKQLTDRQQPLMLAIKAGTGITAKTLARISQQLKQQLVNRKLVNQVNNSPPPLSVWSHSLLYPKRYLLSDFDTASLHVSIKKLWQSWQLGLVLNKKRALADPGYQGLKYLRQSSLQTHLTMQDDVWMISNVNNQKTALLLLQLKHHSMSRLVSFIQKFNKMQHARFRSSSIHISYSSANYIAYQAKRQISNKIQWLSLLTGGFLLLFLSYIFRSPKWLFYSFIPLISAVIIASVLVNLLYGSINALTLALGIVLIGVAVDYPIHAFIALRQNPKQATAIWPIIQLGGLTTLCGFAILLTVNIPGIQQMALFSALGITTALIATHLLMQVLRAKLKAGDKILSPDKPSRWPKLKKPYHTSIILTLLAVSILVLKPLVWQDDLASLSPIPKQLLSQDAKLRKLFQQPEAAQFLIQQAPDIETLLQEQEVLNKSLQQLRHDGVISGFIDLASLLPSQKLQQQRKRLLPTTVQIEHQIAAAGTPLKARHFKSFILAVKKTRKTPLIDLQQFKKLAMNWQKELIPLLVTEQNKRTVSAKILLTDATDAQAISRWAEQHKVTYFQQRKLVTQQIGQLREQLISTLALLLLIFFIFLSVYKRSLIEALKILLPVCLALLLSMASLSLLSQSLTVFHLLASLLVVAMGLDYSLFARHATSASEDSFHSVNIALITTLLSFSLLMLTQLSILIAIGQTVVIGVMWSYFMARLLNRI